MITPLEKMQKRVTPENYGEILLEQIKEILETVGKYDFVTYTPRFEFPFEHKSKLEEFIYSEELITLRRDTGCFQDNILPVIKWSDDMKTVEITYTFKNKESAIRYLTIDIISKNVRDAFAAFAKNYGNIVSTRFLFEIQLITKIAA